MCGYKHLIPTLLCVCESWKKAKFSFAEIQIRLTKTVPRIEKISCSTYVYIPHNLTTGIMPGSCMDVQNFNIWFILHFLDLLMEFLGFFILESHFWNWFKNMFCNRYFNLIYLFLGMIGRNLYINILYVFYLIYFFFISNT